MAEVQLLYRDLALPLNHGCSHFLSVPIISRVRRRANDIADVQRIIAFLAMGFASQEGMNAE